jgi:hypothetical protein
MIVKYDIFNKKPVYYIFNKMPQLQTMLQAS